MNPLSDERQSHKILTYTQTRRPTNGLKNQTEEKVWTMLLGQKDKDLQTWRIIAVVSLVCLVLSVFGWFRTITLPRTAPLIVEVNQEGIPTYRGKIDNITYKNYDIKDYMIQAHITQFITLSREVHVDAQMMKELYNKSFYMITKQIRSKLVTDIDERRPFQLVGRARVKVVVEPVIKITGDSWQAEWVEEYSTIEGRVYEKKRYRGIFTIYRDEPDSEEMRLKNPLGLWIAEYNISEIKPNEVQ